MAEPTNSSMTSFGVELSILALEFFSRIEPSMMHFPMLNGKRTCCVLVQTCRILNFLNLWP